jgi:hypothetical protein
VSRPGLSGWNMLCFVSSCPVIYFRSPNNLLEDEKGHMRCANNVGLAASAHACSRSTIRPLAGTTQRDSEWTRKEYGFSRIIGTRCTGPPQASRRQESSGERRNLRSRQCSWSTSFNGRGVYYFEHSNIEYLCRSDDPHHC